MFSDDDDTIEYDSPARRSAPVGAVSGGAGILAPLRAADDAPRGRSQASWRPRFRAMKAYTVTFAVEGDDFAAEGSYAVEGDRYYMRVGDAEAYSDGVSKWEVDPSKREVVVDVGRHAEPQPAGQPDAGVRFPGRRLPQRTAALRRRGAPSAAHAGRQGGGDEFDHGRRRRRRIAACGDLRSRRRADAYRDPAGSNRRRWCGPSMRRTTPVTS